METGSEGEVTNNDFPLRKTGMEDKVKKYWLCVCNIMTCSLGTEPPEGSPEAARDGTSLQSTQQTSPATVAQEEAAQLVSASQRVSAPLSVAGAAPQGAQSTL